MSERERFEAWALSENFNVDRHYDDARGEYHRATTRWAWMAWRAARSGQAASGSSQGARSDVQNGVGQPGAPTAAPLSLAAKNESLRYDFSRTPDFGDILDWMRKYAPEYLAHHPARSGADFSTSDPCPSCRGVGSIGEPPIQCPFCRLHKLGQEAARSGAGSDDRKDESWK